MTEQQRDRDIAEMEAQMAHDTDQYFNARPQIMRTRDKETTFEAGFKAAWKARALSHAEGEAVERPLGAAHNARVFVHRIEDGPYQTIGTYYEWGELRRCLDAMAEYVENGPAPQVAVPEGWKLVPKRATKEMAEAAAERRGCVVSANLYATINAAIAAAPTAPAGELVTRCTAGLGCDEKGHCDAAATGQGDMCDRRTMAHERPVSDPDGLGAERSRRLETATVAKLLFNAWSESEPDHAITQNPASYAETFTDMAKAVMPLLSAPAPDEREIAAKALDDFMFDVAAWVRLLSDSSQEARVLRKVNGWLHSRAKRLRAGKEGEPS
jgi:hypothetical protein